MRKLFLLAVAFAFNSCTRMVYTNQLGHKEVWYNPAKSNYQRYQKELSSKYKIEPFDTAHCLVSNAQPHIELLNTIDVENLTKTHDRLVFYFLNPLSCGDDMDLAMISSLIKDKRVEVFIVSTSYDLDYTYRKLKLANLEDRTIYVLPWRSEFSAQGITLFIKDLCYQCFIEKKEDLMNAKAFAIFNGHKTVLFQYDFSNEYLMKLTY